MTENIHRLLIGLVISVGLACTASATPLDVSAPQTAVPPNIATQPLRPMMMLAVSKDHTLFGPVYTDFEDIDGDGAIDTTFLPAFKYYGYYDAAKCYAYSGARARFEPAVMADVISSGDARRFACPSSGAYWSGNFLNWSTMTRLDIVRKMLYGGKRSTDTDTATVLERANLSQDSHSFVKYYRGDDIRDYTPFTRAALTKASGSNAGVYAGLSLCVRSSVNGEGGEPTFRMARGNYRLWATTEGTGGGMVCGWSGEVDTDRVRLGAKLARYYKDADKGGGGIAHEAAMPSPAVDGATYNGLGPDLVNRVKVCEPGLIGDEHCQSFGPTATSTTVTLKPYGLLQEFGFPSGSTGAARAEFGVITGSYDNNLTAGALRKNMGDFSDEISPATGRFCHNANHPASGTSPLSDACAPSVGTAPNARPTGNGAIAALDRLVLYGAGGYGAGVSRAGGMRNGGLPAWGNPMGEMLVQALQYYAGVASSNPASAPLDRSRGLPVAAWSDPLSNSDSARKASYGHAMCRPLNVLALSSSALSFDQDGGAAFATLRPGTAGSLDAYTDLVGASEKINGTARSVGSASAALPGATGNDCSAKTVRTLSSASGICPESPSLGGSYQIAGAALYGNTTELRTPAKRPADLPAGALRAKTYAASLTGGAARIEVPIPNTVPQRYVYITPESVWSGSPAAPLTFASISSSATHGAFIVTWNDVLFGGDYDMDMAGYLRYDIVAPTTAGGAYKLVVTTDVVNVGGATPGAHGFSIMGANKPDGSSADGRYLTHLHRGSDGSAGGIGGLTAAQGNLCENEGYRAGTSGHGGMFTNPQMNTAAGSHVCNVSSDALTVRDENTPILATFLMRGVNDVLLQDPLWYAAKYGSFMASGPGDLPDTPSKWDSRRADGNLACGAAGQPSCSDGIPDGYFLARRPELLEQQLRMQLEAIAAASNTAPAMSSTQLVAGSFKYVARFDPTRLSGAIESYKVDASGAYSPSASWEAGLRLTASARPDAGVSRNIVTNGQQTALPFVWPALKANAAYATALTTASTNPLPEASASALVDYLRGSAANEGPGLLRSRGDSILGPIISATPWLQDRPSAKYSDAGYRQFASSQARRGKVLWVAANDAMVHGFDAQTGDELAAYVPGLLANRLNEVAIQRTGMRTRLGTGNFTSTAGSTDRRPAGNVWAFADGSPFSGDVRLANGDWKTYLFATPGRGGKGMFALDVTDTARLSTAQQRPADLFKWQFTSDDDPDFGYITHDVLTEQASGQASPVVRLNNGKFAVMVGNGHKSSNGKAALFLLFVDGPSAAGTWTESTHYRKLVADDVGGGGLSNPLWIDLDNNGTADVVYAGDLKGRLWKFDLSSPDAANWKVAFKTAGTGVNLPLFTARSSSGTALPITTAPQFAFHKSGGYFIHFGTGLAFDAADYPDTAVTQRFYGIWERPGMGSTGGRPLPPVSSVRNGITDPTPPTLVRQTYTRIGSNVVATAGTRFNEATQDGWFMDFPGSSEMLLSNPELRGGLLIFTTVRPKSSDADSCTAAPDASLYAINPFAGQPVADVQGTTTVDGVTRFIAGVAIADQKVRISTDQTRRATETRCTAGSPGCACAGSSCTKTASCATGGSHLAVDGASTAASQCTGHLSLRLQWREVPGLRTDQ